MPNYSNLFNSPMYADDTTLYARTYHLDTTFRSTFTFSLYMLLFN